LTVRQALAKVIAGDNNAMNSMEDDNDLLYACGYGRTPSFALLVFTITATDSGDLV
jgi:hypothetical protein